VDLESSDAVHDVVVDALGDAAVSFSTRLPIAFQDGGRIVGKRCELWRGRTSNQREAAQQRTDVATRTVSEAHQRQSNAEASRLTQIYLRLIEKPSKC
jgi:hypothetical protein